MTNCGPLGWVTDKERGYRWVLSRGLAVRNGDSSPYRMVGAQSDITERKLAEERLRHECALRSSEVHPAVRLPALINDERVDIAAIVAFAIIGKITDWIIVIATAPFLRWEDRARGAEA